MKVLYIEDNKRLAELVKKNLVRSSFVVDLVSNLEEADTSLLVHNYDVAILDLNLPDGDGIEFLKKIRSKKNNIPILILTANNNFETKIKGLDLGADDFLTKPFKHEELVARLKALLRRPREVFTDVSNIKNVSFNHNTYELMIDKKPVSLSKRESQVLEIFIKKYNKVVTKSELEEKNYESSKEINSNPIEVSLHRLRKVLSENQSNIEIKNLRGIGYILK
ncbi:MAG: response regulator transcription factor [Pelagibacteraceae bacterium]